MVTPDIFPGRNTVTLPFFRTRANTAHPMTAPLIFAKAFHDHARVKIVTLVLLGIAMLTILTVSMPYQKVDRTQENVYLGIPYRLLGSDGLVIAHGDPFEEMGPQSVYP